MDAAHCSVDREGIWFGEDISSGMPPMSAGVFVDAEYCVSNPVWGEPGLEIGPSRAAETAAYSRNLAPGFRLGCSAAMLPATIHLIAHTPELPRAWRECFDHVAGVEVHDGDFFSVAADAMVSPANSFGIMDGGLDAAIRDVLGFGVQNAVQRVIVERHHGELPVGLAEIVATEHERWPWLVAAPTMRVPENVARTTNAYLAFRATLLAVMRHNASGAQPIRSLVCPGLGTGVGQMDPRRCAAQMRIALLQLREPARILSFERIHDMHIALMSC